MFVTTERNFSMIWFSVRAEIRCSRGLALVIGLAVSAAARDAAAAAEEEFPTATGSLDGAGVVGTDFTTGVTVLLRGGSSLFSRS